MNVGIVGAGTAGCAAAIFLRRLGHDVTLYERVPDPQPIGAGIVLQPTGLAALAALGLAEAVVARAAPLAQLRVHNARGWKLVDLKYREVAPSLTGYGLHRGALFEILLAAARAAGATVRLGVTVKSAAQRRGAQRVCVDDQGVELGAHDLMLIADGARSQLRAEVGAAKVADYRWGALWFVATDPERVFGDELHQTVDGTHTLLGLLPTGLGPKASASDGNTPLVSMFWSVRDDQAAALRGTGPGFAAWQARVLALAPRASSVLAQIPNGDALLFSSYKRVSMRQWHGDAIATLGDAGHAMSPQLGQGANLALYDALVLAESLAAEPNQLSAALARYTAQRRAHVEFYARATYWLTPLFQSDSWWLGPLRDLGMGLMTRIAPLRMQMTRSMCGLKLGVFRRSLSHALPRSPLALPAPQK